ncbi:MAG TPA: M23 family metallopeptidase [bacterium]|nr:M23 family metallopeptidase [bacterium]
MASSPRKLVSLFLLSLLLLPGCGDFRAIFNGKPDQQVARRKNKKPRKPSPEVLQQARGKFLWPAEGPINSPYGPRSGKMHDGIDVGGDEGDPILAAAGGEVVYADRLGGYGNLIVVKHEDGFFTAYAHNEKNLVDKGDTVKQGQRIAKMGRTGNASGDHLHFEIRDESGTYDPEDFLPERRYTAK